MEKQSPLAILSGCPTVSHRQRPLFLSQRRGGAEAQSSRTTSSALCLCASVPLCQKTNDVAVEKLLDWLPGTAAEPGWRRAGRYSASANAFVATSTPAPLTASTIAASVSSLSGSRLNQS